MSRLLPVFPLQLIAFPGNPVALHIFEPRYREMVGEAEANGTEFGIVLAKDNGMLNCGCTVVVEQVIERYPDGRFNVLTRGLRRFQIQSLDHEKACLQAEIVFFDDDDLAEPPTELRDRVQSFFPDLPSPGLLNMPATDRLSFRADALIADLDFKSTLLRSRSETQRLLMLADFLAQWLPRAAYADRMKKAAPTNGHGHKPPVF